MKHWLFLAISLLSMQVQAEYLCNYTAKIGEQDKYNSKGEPLTRGDDASMAIVAGIIRQDRANYHEFNNRDSEDESDCSFSNKQHRATLENMLKKGSAPKSALRQIIYGNPVISVDVYTDHIDISIQRINSRAPRSTIR